MTLEDVARFPESRRATETVRLMLGDLKAHGCMLLTAGALRTVAPLLGQVHEQHPVQAPQPVRGRSLFVVHPVKSE